MMTPRPALAGAALLLLASLAAADPLLATHTAIATPSVSLPEFGTVSIGFCERPSPGLPTNCDAGGVGGAFFDVSSFNSGTDPAASSGACSVAKVTTSLGALDFACGVDTDDDGLIDLFTAGSVPSGAQSGSVTACFVPDDAAGGGDWDDVVVLLGSGGPVPYAGGLASITLDLQDASSC